MLKTVMVHQQKQHKFYNHNLSSLFQCLCITLVIKKLYEFEISTLDDFFNPITYNTHYAVITFVRQSRAQHLDTMGLFNPHNTYFTT